MFVNGIVFSSVNYNQSFNEGQNLPFFYFKNDIFIFCIETLFYLNIPSAILIFMLSFCLTLESIPWVFSKMKGDNNKIRYKTILIFRSILAFLVLSIGLFDINEYFIIVVSGSILGPIILFACPVIYIIFVNYRSGVILFIFMSIIQFQKKHSWFVLLCSLSCTLALILFIH